MSKTSYWYCPNCKEEIDPRNVTFQELHDSCGHAVEWIEGINLDRLREMCEAEKDGRVAVLPKDFTPERIRQILDALSDAFLALNRGVHTHMPLAIMMVRDMLENHLTRPEAEAALKGASND